MPGYHYISFRISDHDHLKRRQLFHIYLKIFPKGPKETCVCQRQVSPLVDQFGHVQYGCEDLEID